MIITKPIPPFDLLGCTGFFICFDEKFKINILGGLGIPPFLLNAKKDLPLDFSKGKSLFPLIFILFYSKLSVSPAHNSSSQITNLL